MYRTCIFCSGSLGANDALEAFPVGRTVAFDAAAGRLWAVCPRCARWNLAPLEERWEPVEDAERLFRDARLRVQSENVGLAKLRDGTRLVRVGAALPGELAAWRYGAQLRSRRTRYWALTGAVAVGAAVYAGLGVTGLLGGSAGMFSIFVHAYNARRAKKTVYRLDADASPTGEALTLQRHQLNRARLTPGDGDVALHLPEGLPAEVVRDERGKKMVLPARSLVLTGDAARAVLTRAMVTVNRKGAGQGTVDDALARLAGEGGPEAYLRSAAVVDRPLDVPYLQNAEAPWNARAAFQGGGMMMRNGAHAARRERKQRLDAVSSLALEMALHEESERRALQGELAGLEAAWREAEEIASIADSLLDPPSLPKKG